MLPNEIDMEPDSLAKFQTLIEDMANRPGYYGAAAGVLGTVYMFWNIFTGLLAYMSTLPLLAHALETVSIHVTLAAALKVYSLKPMEHHHETQRTSPELCLRNL